MVWSNNFSSPVITIMDTGKPYSDYQCDSQGLCFHLIPLRKLFQCPLIKRDGVQHVHQASVTVTINIHLTLCVCPIRNKTHFLSLHLILVILFHCVPSSFPLGILRARGARLGPCDTDCPGCLLQPPACWPYSLHPRTEPGCGGGSWWPWRPSGPMTLTAGSPCSLVGRPGTEAWTCPPGSSCATQWSHHGGLPSGCRPPIRDRGDDDVHFKIQWCRNM